MTNPNNEFDHTSAVGLAVQSQFKMHPFIHYLPNLNITKVGTELKLNKE